MKISFVPRSHQPPLSRRLFTREQVRVFSVDNEH